MLADGSLKTVRRPRTRICSDLWSAATGCSASSSRPTLDIADNLVYQTGRRVIDYKEFPAFFARAIEKDANIGLMYGHLSTAPSTFLKEMMLYTYTKVATAPTSAAARRSLGRQTAAAYDQSRQEGPLFQELKWLSEKNVEHRIETCTVTRGAGDRVGRGLPRQPQRSDARFGALSAQRCPTIPTSCTNISFRAASSSALSTACARC